MRRLNMRGPRFAGLLALMLAAVALLAVSGVATAKDHGRDDNGHHHGRHHDHGRHNGRHFDLREAGTVSSFDSASGKLTVALQEGGTVTGLVTDNTRIKCEGVDDRLRRDHGSGDDNSGPGNSGDDNGGQSGDDNGGRGQAEPGDDNGGRGEPEPGDDNGGELPPVGAPEGEMTCGVGSLVPGALVGDAELRLESGSAVFEEIELGHDS